MKVMTLVNEKGGVGKTTLAVHLAMGLARRKFNVMLVDADAQGHSTVRCGMKKGPGLYDLLVRDGDWQEVARPVARERYAQPGDALHALGHLFVVGSNVETRNIANSISDAYLLAERIEELRPRLDYVIVDTSPTPSLLHGAIYTATDTILYPVMLTYTAFDGLVESIKRRMAADKTRSQRYGLEAIQVAGVVPMAFRSVTNEHQYNLERLRENLPGLVWDPIPQRVIWQESEGKALPVWQLEPWGDAARDAWGIIDRVEELDRVTA